MIAAALSVVESSRLTDLESVIARCRMSFVDAGEALREIRDGRLYRTQFGTFEEYCQQRWGFTPQHSNRLVMAARVVKAIEMEPIGSITPQTESQARELTRLEEPDQQLAAWQAVVGRVEGDAKKVTAKIVREEVSRFLPEPDDEPFHAFEEIATVCEWLMKRRLKWPAELRPAFAKQLRLIADDMEVADADDGRQGTGGAAADHREAHAG